MRQIGRVASLFLGLAAVAAAEPPVLRYVPKHEELKYTFGGVAPTHRIKPGTRIVSWTEDCFDGALNKPGQKLSEVLVPGRDNPQTGPFYVEGAEPGDTLVIRIEKLEPARDYGVSAGGPGFGALKGTDKTAMLGPELPEAVWFYDVDRSRGIARTRSQDGKLSWEVPLAPFLGCLGVAPAYGEARSTVVPDNFGGNMDCPEVRAGNTVYLGVRVPGALVSFGDGHYAMGDGEIMGTAIEGAMNVELTVDLIKHRETPWPRIENAEWMMSVGAARPLEDAARIAFKDMVRWVQEKTGLGELDAYEFVSQNARAPITQIVDPEYTVLVKIPKARLPTPSGTPAAAPTPSASFDARALDTSVDPCVDFYQFACGGWRKANPIPPDQTRWGRFNELAERNREVLHDILERVRDAKPGRSPLEARVGDYYAACMDEGGIEERGTKPLDPILARVEAVASKQDLFRLLGDHEAHALPGVFRFGAAPDLHDSKQTIANVGQGGLGLPDRDDYLKDDAKSKEKRETYVAHVGRMLELLGEGAGKARADAQVVLRIETALASAHLDRTAMRDPRNRDNPMTVAEIKALAPAYDWDAYFGATGAPRFARLNVTSRKYFAEGSGLIDSTPIPDWKTYLRWHVVRAAAPYLGAALVKEDFRFNREYLNGAKEIEPRWKRCVQATDRGLGDDLGRLYVERTFGAEGKARMRRMIEAITEALREDIETLPWMTPETRKKALGKLQAFRTEKVGYPEKWKDYRTVEVGRADYFGNARRAAMFEIKREHERIDKPTDRTLWGMTPPTVNAYYNSANNEIVFPAGILQPPFFDRELDDAVNFGGIGVVIGHEYTHGFDDQGSKFDPEGNLVNWWTPDDLRAFQERTDCIAKEYEGFVSVKDAASGDVHLNGRLTLGENTADNGGLRVAYRALKKTLADKERPRIDGFTPEQRLFLGFANVWCQNVTEQAARQLAQTDTHSPGAFRVIGAVTNMEEFREAFACKAGQPMVRENACRVW